MTTRRVELNSFIMNALLDESKRVEEQLNQLSVKKGELSVVIDEHRREIEKLEAELDSLYKETTVLKSNKANLVEKAEEFKKLRTL